MAINPHTHWGGFRAPESVAPEGRFSLAFVLRSLRLLLAVWWIFAPVILGYVGTFPGRQSMVVGIVLLPVLTLGLFVPEMRWFLLAASVWMVGSTFVSRMYFMEDLARVHDLVTGTIGIVLGLVPGMFLASARFGRPAGARRGHVEQPAAVAPSTRAAAPARRANRSIWPWSGRRPRSLSVSGPVREVVHVSPDDSRAEPPRPIEPPPPPAPHLEDRPPPA